MEPSGSEASESRSKDKENAPVIDVDSENVNQRVNEHIDERVNPRNKLKYLEFCLDIIYPKSRTSTVTSNQGDQVPKRLRTLSTKTIKICNIVEDALKELYVHYKIKLDKHNDQTFSVSSSSTLGEDDMSMNIDIDDGFSKYLETQYGEGDDFTEVDVYLQDGAEKRGVILVYTINEIYNVAEHILTLVDVEHSLKSAKVHEKANVIEEPSESITTTSTLTTKTAATTIIASSTRPKAKGLVIHEQEQAPTPIVSSQQPLQAKIQDKGKAKMIEPKPVKKLSKKDQLKLNEEGL
ncbi:hypothetical protein Tco_0531793 [Tanacetum coccineum]